MVRNVEIYILTTIIMLAALSVSSAAISPPTNVISSLSGTSLTVNWTEATGATQYRVGLYNVTGTNNTLMNYRYVNTTSTTITVPFVDNCYTVHVRTWLPNQSTNSVVSNKVCGVITSPDIIPPNSITGLRNVSYARNYINWTWTDPADSDFANVMVYIDGIFKTNITKGIRFYNTTTNFASLTPDTAYEISTRTVDTTGNINSAWVNATNRTAPDTIPVPIQTQTVTNLHNISYAQDYINWTWTDPTDVNYSNINIYIDGEFITNIGIGVGYYNATGASFTPDISHEISTQTVDIYDNVNPTWVNDTERTAPLPDTTPPDSITNLRNTSNVYDQIDWAWNDSTSPDFHHVEIFINGVFDTNVSKGDEKYTTTKLNPNTNYKISTHTVDISGNVNDTWKNATARTASKPAGLPTIRFITIGDTHITSNTSKDAYKNFTRAVNHINNMTDVDFVVQVGDIVDSTSSDNFNTSKSILYNLTKPYYIVEGNHDIGSPSGTNFRKYIGPTENIVNFSGYQLIFVGINKNGTKDANNITREYDWIFNYNNADKNKSTIIFSHGPVQSKPGGTCSNWDSGTKIYFSYACSMKPEVDKFINLVGYYAGHVHKGTNQTINGVLYVTEDNLGGAVISGPNSQYIGYTVVEDGRVVSYSTVHY